MNILFLTYQGGVAGSTLSIAYLAEGLAKRGHNIWLGCRPESLLYARLLNSPVRLIPMEFKSKIDFGTIKKIRDIVKDADIRIINAQSSYDRYLVIFARIFYRLPCKIVHTRRQISRSDGGLLHGLFYYKFTDRIVAVSRGVKKSLINLGIPENHIEVIHNGTPKEKYRNISNEKVRELRRNLNLKTGDFVIGCVSRKKQQEQLLEALSYLEKDFKVVFVGINRTAVYDEVIKRMRLPQTIHFTGRVDVDEVLHYYPLFNVHVMPSVTEGLSQSVLEAMALGVPNVATAAAGNLDVIRHGENGLLFEEGNSRELARMILAIRNDPDLTIRIIRNGKNTAFHDFSIENTIKRYEEFFSELVSS